jgi:cytochrome oxidase Cu insertion factor (SCO1/SenC/PrrC family)
MKNFQTTLGIGVVLTGHVFGSNMSGKDTTQPAPARPELALPRSSDFDYDPPEPGSYTLPVLKDAADGEVLDAHGRKQSLQSLVKGRITVLSFIYTRCASANACPRATGMLKQVHRLSERDASLADALRLVTLSFDPVHDTPERMAKYAAWSRTEKPAAEWLFLTTPSVKKLRPILDAYDQEVDRRANMDDPLGPYFHPVRVCLIDRQGYVRNIYSFGTLDPRLVVTDVRTLMLEEQAAGRINQSATR